MNIFTSIESIFPIILIIALGYILNEKKWFGESFGANLSKLIMNVALPSSIFVSVLKYLTLDELEKVSSGLFFTFGAVIIAYISAYLVIKVFKVPRGRRGLMLNMFANANTIFIGLPLNIALFGDNSISYFLVYYITNTISTWTIGAFLIARDSKNSLEKHESHLDVKKLLPPPLIGFLISLVFLLFKIPVPSFVTSTLTYLGGIVTPLSLIYIGIVLSKAGISSIKFDKDVILSLFGRYIISPLAMLLLLFLFGKNLPHLEYNTYIVQSAVPGLAILPILANEANSDVEYATAVVTTSTLLFAVVMPIVILFIS